MSGWTQTRLSQIVTFRTGKLDSNAAVGGGQYPFFTCADTTYAIDRYSFDTECVLLAGNNAAGIFPLKYFRGKFDAYQRTYIIEPKDENALEIKYLYFALRPLLRHFEMSSNGATTKFLTLGILNGFDFSLPPLPVQRKIAAILSAYDDLIENNTRRIALLEKMAEEVYREWFVRLRFPGHESGPVHQGVPEGWEASSCSAVMKLMGGGTPKTDVAVFWNGDIPFFTPRDVDSSFYVTSTEKTLTDKGLKACNSLLFPKNTIFITARGTVGKLALAGADMAMNQTCYALAPKNNDAVYFYFLAIKDSIKYIKGVSKSGVFDNIIMDTFDIIPMLMPSSSITRQFNDVQKPMFDAVFDLLTLNQNLKSTRDMLLSRLLSGKLDVEELDIQFPPGMSEAVDVGRAVPNGE